jgi:hypothetical protein
MPLAKPEEQRANRFDWDAVPRPCAGAWVEDAQLMTRHERERSPSHPPG